MSPTGHLAIGFAAKKWAPKIPLFVFLIAAYIIDLLYLIFLPLGIDSIGYSPWSHSLIMAVAWSAVSLLVTLIFTRDLKSSAFIGLVVFSHWVLDFIVWGNTLITFDRNLRVGLGLYDAIGFSQTNLTALNAATAVVSIIELGMLIAGIAIYLSHVRAGKKASKALAS